MAKSAQQKLKPVMLGSSGGSLLEVLAELEAAAHPLTGLYCLKWSDDPWHTRFGDNWSFQGRIKSVIGDVAMVQLYDSVVGSPSEILPRALADLLSGDWTFYETAQAWNEAANEAIYVYQRGYDIERNHAANADRGEA